jgi:hypothetical protein
MFRLTAAVLGSAVILFAAGLSVAEADVTYSYTGLRENEGGFAPFFPGDMMTGDFTVATALSPSTTYTSVPYTSFSFGVVGPANPFPLCPPPSSPCTLPPPLTNANSVVNDFTAVTDASGDVLYWDISLSSTLPYPSNEDVVTDYCGPYPRPFPLSNCVGGLGTNAIDYEDALSGYVYNFALPGTWTVTPEPSTFLLLGSGLVGLVGAAWRKRCKVSPSRRQTRNSLLLASIARCLAK